MTPTRLLLLVPLLTSCVPEFDPPSDPPHTEEDDEGAGHARGLEEPFLCWDTQTGAPVDCETIDRPANRGLSCDASGCHGGYDFTAPAGTQERHLRGSDGPACSFCHEGEREWSLRVTP